MGLIGNFFPKDRDGAGSQVRPTLPPLGTVRARPSASPAAAAPLRGLPTQGLPPQGLPRAVADGGQPQPESLPRGKVYGHLPKCASVDQVPPYIVVLTATGEKMEQREADRKRCAALQVDDRAIILVWTNQTEAREARNFLLARAERIGFAMRGEIEAPADCILALNTSTQVAMGVVAGVSVDLDKIDEAIDSIVGQAVARKASDIHIEVSEASALVRFRIHGDMVTYARMTRAESEDFSRGLYLRSETGTKGIQFDPMQCQDSSVKRDIRLAGRSESVMVKLRFSSRPAYPSGWDITLRVLSTQTSKNVETFLDLGYNDVQIAAFEYAASQPTGLIAVVGETGSGKSTTLRSISYWLHDASGGRRKQISIENPPEYDLPGRQTPVIVTKEDEENGINPFLRFFKAAMRGDPDILLVGEVRDNDTGVTLRNAVESGHKVLTTLHASSTLFAMTRLMDLGVERSVLTAPKFISAIVYQKLVKTLCPQCSLQIHEMGSVIPQRLRDRISKVVSAEQMADVRFRGPGCARCVGEKAATDDVQAHLAGIIGRTVVAEILIPDATLLDLVARDKMLEAQRYWRAAAHARSNLDVRGLGMGRTVLDHAIAKMVKGVLDPRDVESAVGLLDDQESALAAFDWYRANENPQAGLSRSSRG